MNRPDGPRLTFEIRANTTAALLAQRLLTYRRGMPWLVGDVQHELSPIRDSEDTQGHTKVLLTAHTDGAGTSYPAPIRYVLDDLDPPQAARVLLTIHCYLNSHAVIAYMGQILSNLVADYPAANVAFVVPFALRELAEDLRGEYAELIDWVERQGGRRLAGLRHVWGWGSFSAKGLADYDTQAAIWILNTSAETFRDWLQISWPEAQPIETDGATLFLGRLQLAPGPGGTVGLEVRGSWAIGDLDTKYTLERMPDPVISFAFVPLAADRVEVRMGWRLDLDGIRAHLVKVVDAIAARWPELRDTIQGWDASLPDACRQDQPVDGPATQKAIRGILETARFVVDASMDIFTTWLLNDWGPPAWGGIFYTGKNMNCLQLQALHELRARHAGVRRLAADGIWLTQNSEHATAYPATRTITFDLVPLGSDRVEVKMEFSVTLPGFLQFLAELLNKIGKRWPSMWETLEGAFGAQSAEVPAADTTKPVPENVPERSKQYALSKEDEITIGKEYDAGATIAELAARKSVAETTIRRVLDRQGIDRRPPGPRHKKQS